MGDFGRQYLHITIVPLLPQLCKPAYLSPLMAALTRYLLCEILIYTTLCAAKNFIGSHNDCIHLPDLFQLKSMKNLTNLDFDTKCFDFDSVITRPRHDR